MKHVLLTSLAIIMLALAGCSQVDDTTPQSTDGTQTQDSQDDGADEGNQTQDGGEEQDDEDPAPNTPPTAELVADLLNGSAPLTVNFTVDGSDADGDDLTWALSLNGTVFANGTQLPGDANITFEAAGNFTVVLEVSDGRNTTMADVTIAVSSGAPAVEPIFETFHMVEGCELCIDSELVTGERMGADGCAGWNLGENEVDCAWLAIPEDYVGTPWSAFSYTDGTIPLLGTDGDVDVEFYDACDPDGTPIDLVRENSFGEPESGTIPEGAGCIVGFEFSWPNLGHTIEISLGEVAHE